MAEFNNLRCTRSVDNSYSAIRIVWWGFSVLGQYQNRCRDGAGTSWSEGSSVGGYTCQFKQYSCDNGGINLNNGICKKIDTEYKAFSSF
ncbi:hypothetical protein [Aliarcobacter butzleri]|uniref:hypothetical protein n=1 Tax=Aliarcobacter butzleri TaxID=28197 RepID=UPI002B251EB3|nr:hypothetical protein [Aliarcobacter butzleri]